MKLLEVFKDFEVRVRGKSCRSRYDAEYIVEPRQDPKIITLEDLNKYVEELQRKYPDRNFYLYTTRVNGVEYHVVTRKKRLKLPDGVKYVSDRVPIYVDLKSQRFYVPQYYVKRRYKLTCYIIMRVLGTLGVARVRYAGIIGRASSTSEQASPVLAH
ncbi:MAG: hypothetical protein QW407_02645 [Thermofilaceae archaeon]